MKKVLISAVLFMFMLSGVSFATDTRVMTMGEANMIVKDEANVWMFPSTINYYPKLVGGCIWDGDLQCLYGHMMFAEESSPMVMGFYFYTYNDGLPMGAPWPGDYNRLDLLYGRYLGENPFGLMIEYDQASHSEEATDYNPEQSFMRLNFTFGLSLAEKKFDLAAHVGFSSWKDVAPDGTDNREPSGNTELGFWGRYWMEPKGKWTMVPHAGFWMGSEGYKELPDGDEYKDTDMMFELGLGTNYDAGEDILMVTDLGFRYESYKYEYPEEAVKAAEDKETGMFLPYFKLGLDAPVVKWLDVRCGVVSEWYMWTDENNDGDKEKWNEVDTWTYLGAGFHWGNFMIDAEINPEFLQDGPYFLTGSGDSYYDKTEGGFAWEVSMIYWLD